MKLAVDDITEIPTTLTFSEDVEDLAARLRLGAPDWRSTGALACELTHYRAASDLVLTGVMSVLPNICAV